MKAHLIQIDATTLAGAATSIYLSSVDDASVCHLDGKQWIPALARLPQLRYDFFGGDFGGSITTPSASFSAAIDSIAGFTGLRYSRARVRLWTGNVGDAWANYVLRFDGRIKAEPELSEAIAQFEATPDDAWLDKPLLALYAGTGGVEGPDALEGQPKPLVMGNARFVPGVLIDAVDNVYQVSGYGPVQAINATYDRALRLGGPVADYATLAALLAATIPNGSTATCKALGLVRLGAPGDGLITFDVSGANTGSYARRPGAIIGRIAAIAGGAVDAANLAALDTARPYNLSVVLTDQTTAREVIQQIADSVCAVAGVSWAGKLFLQPLGYTAPVLTLASDGSALPPVASVAVQSVAAPFWRLATEAEITWAVHAPGDVASEYVIRGAYNPARVYRLDDMVSAEDGSAWVYINATAGAGHALPVWPLTSNAHWQNVGTPSSVDWDYVGDPNGTKPEDNATVGAPVGTDVGGVPAEDLVDAVGQFAADIAQLDLDIIAADAAIGVIQGEAAAMQADMTAAQNDIAAQGGEIATLESAVATANANIGTNATAITGVTGSLATLSTTVSAQAGRSLGALNKNAGFDDYPSAAVGAVPVGWTNEVSGAGGGYRVADPQGGWAYRLPGLAGANSYVGQDGSGLSPDSYHVIEADIVLHSGGLTGAGVLLSISGAASHNITFSTNKDSTDSVPGAGVAGRSYQFRKLIRIGAGAVGAHRLFPVSHSSAFGSVAAANDITWQKVLIRPATPAEIRDQTVLAPMEATVATHSTAIATAEGALASHTMSIGAALSGGSAVKNPNFAFYTNATGGADDWRTAQTAGITRVPGKISPYAMRIPGAAGAESYAMQVVGGPADQRASTGQWWVIEADVELDSGALTGAAVLFRPKNSGGGTVQSSYVAFATEKDSTGAVVGAGAVGRSYSFSKLVQITGANAHYFELYPMAHAAAAGSTATANAIIFDRVSARPATQPEIDTQTVLPAVKATADSNTFALATLDGTVAGHTLLLTSQGASISTNATAISTATGNLATLTGTVTAQGVTVTNTATALTTTQGNVATLFGKYGVELSVNGYATGFVLNNNGARGNAIFDVDYFGIGKTGASTSYPFEVSGGVTYIKSAVIKAASIEGLHVKDLTLGTVKLSPYAASVASFVTSSTIVSLTNNTSKWGFLAATIAKTEPDSLLEVIFQAEMWGSDAVNLDVFCNLVQSGTGIGVAEKDFRVQVDGNGQTTLPFCYSFVFSGVPVGTYIVNVSGKRWDNNHCATSNDYHLLVREFKR